MHVIFLSRVDPIRAVSLIQTRLTKNKMISINLHLIFDTISIYLSIRRVHRPAVPWTNPRRLSDAAIGRLVLVRGLVYDLVPCVVHY
jgi:hypothetical protein